MLRVTTVYACSAGTTAEYYAGYVAREAEVAGHWAGRQAAGLGLTGTVGVEQLEVLLSGRDPVSGTLLGAALHDRVDAKGKLIKAVAGYEGTFSAPKSVSVWWALTGDPRLLAAHDAAVTAVLDHVEGFGSTTRVRVNGARMHPETSGLVMAVFRQHTSREDDPQLHTHVVFSAKVQADDGRWLALDGRYLKQHQRALGGLYQSVLRAELSATMGVAWGPIENGQAEIAGVPTRLLDQFSLRTRQIEAAMVVKVADFAEANGREPSRVERARLTRQAVLDSRRAKTHAGLDELHARWGFEATMADCGRLKLTRLIREAADAAAPEPGQVRLEEVLDVLSAKASTWTRVDVVRAVCDTARPVPGLSGAEWARAVEHAADRVIAACTNLDPEHTADRRVGDARSVWLPPTEPHLTHPRVIAEEEAIIRFAETATRGEPAVLEPRDRARLDVLQAQAAAAAAGHDRLVLVVGPAGTGKTTMLCAAVDTLQASGRVVVGVSPTAKGAKVLAEDTGLRCDTVAHLLHHWANGRPPGVGAGPMTVIVDEAGMLGTASLAELTRLAGRHDWRLVLVGDPAQLHAVGRGGMFDELCATQPAHPLTTVHRFVNPWEAAASLELRHGNARALDTYEHHGRVHPGTLEDRVAEAATRWLTHTAHGRTVAVVAETNAHVDQLNAAIQQARVDAGHLGPDEQQIAGGELARVGDIVTTRRNDRTLRTDRGEPVRNRDHWTVTALSPSGDLTVSHNGGHGHIRLPAEYVAGQVRLGYAGTAHASQGATVDHSLTLVTEATTHRSLYVGATRGRQGNDLLVVTPHDAQPRDVLEQVLRNDRVDQPARVQRANLARMLLDAPIGGPPRWQVERERHLQPYRDAVDAAKETKTQTRRALDRAAAAADKARPWQRRATSAALAAARVAHDKAACDLDDKHSDLDHEITRYDRERAPQRTAENRRRLTTRLAEAIRTHETRDPARALGRHIEGPDLPGR